MNNTSQNVLHLVIIIVIAVFFFWVSPIHDRAVHGVLLPTHAPMAATSASDVKIYRAKPAGTVSLGLLNTSKHFDKTTKEADKVNFSASLKFAKALAAKSGATGMVFLGAGPGGSTGPLDSFATAWIPVGPVTSLPAKR